VVSEGVRALLLDQTTDEGAWEEKRRNGGESFSTVTIPNGRKIDKMNQEEGGKTTMTKQMELGGTYYTPGPDSVLQRMGTARCKLPALKSWPSARRDAANAVSVRRLMRGVNPHRTPAILRPPCDHPIIKKWPFSTDPRTDDRNQTGRPAGQDKSWIPAHSRRKTDRRMA